MSHTATINKPAPQPEIERWVQRHEPEISNLTGQVVLIEVIQLNCPDCFVHALPEVIRLHETYESQGLKVFAIVAAFEHFEHNTLNKLQRLVQHGELTGDPLFQLAKANFLENNKLPYSIPFSVAMDKLDSVKRLALIVNFIDASWPNIVININDNFLLQVKNNSVKSLCYVK